MAAVEKFRKHPESGRTMHLLELDSAEDWPEEISLGKSKHFVLFLAMDASDSSDEDVAALARTALDQGMVYLSTWGKDSERVHDVFEEAAADRDPDSDVDTTILSEWHEDEPLSAALRFAVASAFPAADYEATCTAVLAVVVGNPDAADLVREWLKDPRALDAAAEAGEDVAGQEEDEEKEEKKEDVEDEDDDLEPDDDEEEDEDEEEEEDAGDED
jgi:hypothetical protein